LTVASRAVSRADKLYNRTGQRKATGWKKRDKKTALSGIRRGNESSSKGVVAQRVWTDKK